MALALKEGRAIQGEEAIAERPDGTRRWFSPFPTPLRDAEGKIVGAINMLVDITERKGQELSSNLLAAIVDSSDDAIVSKNLNGVITSWNQSAERIFGYSYAEAIGQHITMIIPSDRQKEEAEILARLRRGERVDHFDTVRRRKDGRLVDVSLTISPIRDATGTIVGASKVARDVSERKRADRTQGLLSSIVDSSDDAIVSKSLDGVITSWNRSAERMFGYSEPEAIGQRITLIIPSDRLEEEKEIIAKLRQGEQIDHFDTVRRRKDGSLLDVSLTISPVHDAAGRVIGASKVARDISDRKRTEHTLAHAAREQRALFHLADSLHRAQSLDQVYDAAMTAICEAVDCDRTAILLLDSDDVMRFAAWRGLSELYRTNVEGHSPWKAGDENPQIVSFGNIDVGTFSRDLKRVVQAEGIGALAFIPLVSKNKLIGKFMTYYAADHEFTKKELEICTTIAQQVSFAIERKKSEQELRSSEERLRLLSERLDAEVRSRTEELEQRNADLLCQSMYVRSLSRRLLKAQDEERRHIARELHDSAGQTLTVLGMNLAQLLEKIKTLDPRIVELAQASEQMVQQLHREIRTTSYLLHPPLLDENGLASALALYRQGLSNRSRTGIHLEIAEDFGRIPMETELVAFRLVQECLTNVHRHAGADNVVIRVSRQADRVSVEVEDDGHGMSAQKLAEVQSGGSGVGIRGMRERVCQLQGDLEITSDSSGTRVRASIPIPDTAIEGISDGPQETAA
jgi:PAS domain S-box-containing protein